MHIEWFTYRIGDEISLLEILFRTVFKAISYLH